MIKLIASDLDGTLLLPDGSLPEETFEIIEKLHASNVLFCVASGRQYESLKRLFAPVFDKVIFIAENGALVFYKGKQLFGEYLSLNRLHNALSTVRLGAGYPLLCCADYAYAESDYPPFLAECSKYYPHLKRIERLEDAPELDAVCKIALFSENGQNENLASSLKKELPALRVIVSGKVWTDVSMPETNKGKALNFIQTFFNFKREECVAFGDYMNDFELLLACQYAYVTENGFPLLKEKIGCIIPSNAERGVIQKIKEYLGEQK